MAVQAFIGTPPATASPFSQRLPRRAIEAYYRFVKGARIMSSDAAPAPSLQFDRIAATVAALVVVGLAVFLLVRNQAIADPRLFFVLRVVLSFSAATLGATIPGFLTVRWSGHGLAIRAGGAIALFALTFVYTPDLVVDQDISKNKINQSSSGPLSPPIANNKGQIIIQGTGTGK
jgi:hypothetical protein